MQRTRTPTSPLFVLVATVVIIAALSLAKEVLLPVALSVLLSFLLTPMANRLERWGLPRIPSVLGVAALAFTVIGVLIWVVVMQAIDLREKLDTYKVNIVAKVRAISDNSSGPISKFADTIDELGKEIQGKGAAKTNGAQGGGGAIIAPDSTDKKTEPREDETALAVKVVEPSTSVVGYLRDWLGPLVAPLGTAGLVVVLVVFMLIQREDQRNRFIELFGRSNLHVTTEALTDAAKRVSRYLRMQFLVNAGYGATVAIALVVLGVPNAPMWGVLCFMLRFLPYIGPILAASMPIAVSAAVSSGWTQPLLVLGWFIVLELVVNNLVEPWVYGSTIGVSAVGIIVAAIFWTWLWGPIGLVLAMPLTVCLVVLAHYVPQLRFVTVLLGDKPAMSLAERTYQRLLAMDEIEVRKVAKHYLKSESLLSYYDDVLIPALSLAERDRHSGLLHDEQLSFIEEAAEDLVEEFAELAASDRSQAELPVTDEAIETANARAAPRARVLCIPLRDRADQTATMMLAQMLAADGFHVDLGSVDSLTNELVDEVDRLDSQIVVISILPPSSPRNSRLLYRRLHNRFPNVRVIVGYWDLILGDQFKQRFELEDPDKLVTSLAEAAEAVRHASASIQGVTAPASEADTASGGAANNVSRGAAAPAAIAAG